MLPEIAPPNSNRIPDGTIGPARFLTVSQARRKARAIVAAAILGSDPQNDRQELRSIPTLSQFVRELYLPFAKVPSRSW